MFEKKIVHIASIEHVAEKRSLVRLVGEVADVMAYAGRVKTALIPKGLDEAKHVAHSPLCEMALLDLNEKRWMPTLNSCDRAFENLKLVPLDINLDEADIAECVIVQSS